jgi:hypothetical protein
MADKSMLSALNGELAVKQADAERIAAAFPVDEKGRFAISTEMHADYVRAVKDAQEIKSVIDSMTVSTELGSYLSAPEAPSAAAVDAGTRGYVSPDGIEAQGPRVRVHGEQGVRRRS